MDDSTAPKSTPGPWERYGYIGQPGLTRVRACTGTDTVGRKQFVDIPANASDAVLIAAAPELAEALRELQHAAEFFDHDDERCVLAVTRAAKLLERVGY